MATWWLKIPITITRRALLIFRLVTLVVLGFLPSCAKKESPPPALVTPTTGYAKESPQPPIQREQSRTGRQYAEEVKSYNGPPFLPPKATPTPEVPESQATPDVANATGSQATSDAANAAGPEATPRWAVSAAPGRAHPVPPEQGSKVTPDGAEGPAPSPPATSDTLPPFFPPKATSTADLSSALNEIFTAYRTVQGKGPSMKQLDGDLTAVLEEAGYERVSHYWLEGQDNPGFGVVTHIEFIDDLGRPVMNHRFETNLPTPNWFSGADFLKALVLPRNGRYRLIALVVAQKALAEKPDEITHEQVEKINHGPNALSGRDWADLEVTPQYNFTAYIYEFYRKSRSEPITVLPDSNITASRHLASIDFVQNISDRMRSFPRP